MKYFVLVRKTSSSYYEGGGNDFKKIVAIGTSLEELDARFKKWVKVKKEAYGYDGLHHIKREGGPDKEEVRYSWSGHTGGGCSSVYEYAVIKEFDNSYPSRPAYEGLDNG